MSLKTSQKNPLVKVVVKRRFRYFQNGKKFIAEPAEDGKKPKVIEIPLMFANEMASAGKVSFDKEAVVDVDPAK